MPSVAARDYRCSWEIPYDFHPRIHAYPGASSVVRAYIDSTPATQKAADGQQRVQKKKGKTQSARPRHYRLQRHRTATREVVVRQEWVSEPSQTVSVAQQAVSASATRLQPSAPSWRRVRRPRGVTSGNTAPVSATAEKGSSGEKDQQRSSDRGSSPSYSASTSAAAAAVRKLIPRKPASHPAVVSVGHTPSMVQPHPPSSPQPQPQQRYGDRTKPRYTLPASYAAYVHQFEREPVPRVVVQDRFTSPPSQRELRLAARRVRCTTREGFVEELRRCCGGATMAGDALPQRVLDSYVDTHTGHAFDVAAHNFNAVLPDAFENTIDARAAALQATEQRMRRRIILDVAPLSAAQSDAYAAGGVSVVDSGHVAAPIIISASAVDSSPSEGYWGGEEDESDASDTEAMAVVVLPFADEVLASSEAVRVSEAQRCWSRGREWDRQAAIRSAVGATAQEAIVTLGIDRRYRQPGDFLLRRSRLH